MADYIPKLSDLNKYRKAETKQEMPASESDYEPTISDIDNYNDNQEPNQPALSRKQQFVQATGKGLFPGINEPSPMQNIAAGILNSLKGLGQGVPDIAEFMPPQAQSNLLYQKGQRPVDNFDPYSAVGTTDQPFTSTQGIEQILGELLSPGKVFEKSGIYGKGKDIAKNIIESISPKKQTKELLQNLSGGAESTQKASRDIAKEIKQKYASNYAQPQINYEFINKQIGDKRLYDKVDPLISTAMDKEKNIIKKVEDLKVGDLFKNFKNNPTYENAHKLQSELGVMIGDLKNQIKMGTATREEINKISNIRNQLKDDIKSFLKKEGDKDGFNYHDMYDKATELYDKNVVPYLSNNKLRQLNREGRTNVEKIEDVFKNPYDIEHPITGKTEKGPINRILEDLTPETKNKMLFNEIGGHAKSEKPLELVDSLKKALQGDFAHLDNPSLQENIAEILKRNRNQNLLKKAGSIGGTGLAVSLGLEGMRHL